MASEEPGPTQSGPAERSVGMVVDIPAVLLGGVKMRHCQDNARFTASFLRKSDNRSTLFDDDDRRKTVAADLDFVLSLFGAVRSSHPPDVDGGEVEGAEGNIEDQRKKQGREELDALRDMAPSAYVTNLNIGDLVLEISHLLTRARSRSPKTVILEWLSNEMRARLRRENLHVNRPLLDYLPKLSQASSKVNTCTTEERIYQVSVMEMLRLMDCDRANVYLYSKKTKTFAMRTSTNPGTVVVCEDKEFLRNVMESNKAKISNNCAEHPRFQLERESDYISQNMLVVPVQTFDGETIGVIQALNKYSGPFIDIDLMICSFFMQHIAVLLRNANMMNAIADRKKDTDLFLEMFNALAQTKNIMKDPFTLQVVVSNAKKLICAERGVLYFFDAEEQDLFVLESDMPEMKHIHFPLDEGVTGAAMHEVQNVRDVKNDPRCDDTIYREMGYDTRNILAVPLRSRPDRQALGVLEFHNKTNDNYNARPRAPASAGGRNPRARQGMSRRGPAGMEHDRTGHRGAVVLEFDSEDVRKIVIFTCLIAAYMEQEIPTDSPDR
eukprot:GEMP01033357.1.p1 GENE.GEMP01033357.1~~GEMP01033357.1.p1  ORF type:complete len:568 (+),score=132.77 GEMP01033357.1:51-1706(+)